MWLHKISRADFIPSSSHRVCSAHILGEKKRIMINIPIIVPKTIKPAEKVQRERHRIVLMRYDGETYNHDQNSTKILKKSRKRLIWKKR